MNIGSSPAVSMRRTTILFAAVFVMQFGGSVGGTGVPLLAKFNFDASVWTLALIGMTQPLTYTVGCLSVGSLVGRVKPLNAALAGTVVQAASYVLAPFATTSWQLALINAGGGLGQALFWPMIEGVISEGADGPRLNRRIGFFNISWSVADAAGTAAAGILFKLGAWLPFEGLVVSMVGTAGVVAMARGRRPDDLEEVPARFAKPALPEEDARRINGRFRRAAWVANFVSAGVVNIVRSVFAAPAKDIFKMSSPMIGLALGMTCMLRTATFVGLREWPGWHYRREVFLAFNVLLALGAGGLFAAAFLPGWAAVALAFVSLSAMGVGSGMTYYSSIFYAVDTEAAATVTARLHEAILGAGAALAVLVAGGADRLIVRAAHASPLAALSPFALSAVMVAAGMIVSGKCLADRNDSRNILELSAQRQYSESDGEG